MGPTSDFHCIGPRLIQSISRNVHNKFRALKQLWADVICEQPLTLIIRVKHHYQVSVEIDCFYIPSSLKLDRK